MPRSSSYGIDSAFIRSGFAAMLAAFICLGAQAEVTQLDIPRLSSAPAIEDFLQGEPTNGMIHLSDFVQHLPYDGEQPNQNTIVYLGYDARNLYVVFLAYDDPTQVRARMSPRENISEDDRVGVFLDPFQDQRRAYFFQANPLGVQRDMFFVEDQGFDTSYDTLWHSEGKVTEWGYVVWMALPFKSIRFSPDQKAPWGLIFQRTVQRNNETSTWPHVSTAIDGVLNQAALVEGILDVSPGKNLQIIPFATSRWSKGINQHNGRVTEEDDYEARIGVDIKKVWRDQIVTDLTINPDFSQIESDEPQVTVNQRFEVFFPERRPFFLENADIFRTPINLLFTRRIIDPQIGARITGKMGPWAIGSLISDDDAPGHQVLSDDQGHHHNTFFGAARISRDIGTQSRLGVMAVQRDFSDESNRVLSADGRFKWDEHWVSSMQAVTSSSKHANTDDATGHAAFISTSRTGRNFNYSGEIIDITNDFDTAAGFVPRVGIFEMNQSASFLFWSKDSSRLVHWGPEIDTHHVWDRKGERLDEEVEASLEWEFPGQTNLKINFNHSHERLTTNDYPLMITDRDYNTRSVSIEYGTSYWKTFSVSGETSLGKRINFAPLPGMEPETADWLQSNLAIAFRPVTQLAIDTTLIFTQLESDATGARVFQDLIARTRLNWQFTRELSLRSIIQYERTNSNPLETTITDRKNWNVDLLFTYRLNPWTAIYLGYNNNQQNIKIDQQDGMPVIVRTSGLHNDSEQLLLKFSYLLRL